MEQQMPYQGETHLEEKLTQFKQLFDLNFAKYSNLPTQSNALDLSTNSYRNNEPMISPFHINVQTQDDKNFPTWDDRQEINAFSTYSQTNYRQNLLLPVPNA